MVRSYAGQLLVSRPDMVDPNFDGTITFLLEDGSDGAVGVMLNRPSSLPVADPFPGWVDLSSPPASIFQGGPVQTNAIIALGRHRPDAPSPADFDLPAGLVSVDLDEQPTLLQGGGLMEIRIFAGYAGWAAGQLEGEIATGAWWVVPGFADDVFYPNPDNLWRHVMERSGKEFRWFANLPRDPSVN